MNERHKITLFLGVWLGLNVLAALGLADQLWGIHLLSFFPEWARGLFLVLIAGLFLPAVREGLCAGADWLAEKIPYWLRPILLVGFALAMFYVFRSATHFLGDGALLLRELEVDDVGPKHRTDHAPLVSYFIGHLKAWGFPAETVYWIYGCVAGVLYVDLALIAARFVGRERSERAVVLLLLLTLGCVVFFFGYVETYALLVPAVLGYLIVGLRVVQTSKGLWLAAILVGVMIPLHMMQAMLIPSLVVLGWQAKNRAWAVGSALVLAGVISGSLLWISGMPPWEVLGKSGGAPFLALSADFHRPYGMISLSHLVDVLNQYALVAPAAIGVLVLCGRKLKPADQASVFLFVAALGPVLFTLIANPKIGAFRDWDVMGVASLPLLVWCAWIFVRHGNVRQDGMALVGVATIQLMLWVGVNADRLMAEARFDRTLRTAVLSPYARSYGWETLGGYYRSQNRLSLALQAYAEAIKADPKHPRHWNAAGNLQRRMGNAKEAVQSFQKAVNIAPEFAGAHSNLGNALNQLGRYNEAINAYEKALALDASLAEAHTNLGVAYHGLGEYRRAIDNHMKALKLKPDFVEALNNLGNSYNASRNYKAALGVLLQAIRLLPGHAFAHVNMGNAYLGLEKYNAALEHLDMALALNPNLVAALFNQGIAFMGVKKFEEAVASFQQVIDKNPRIVKAYHSMGVAYEQLGNHQQVRACYQKVLELDPNYPHAAMIQKWLKENP